MIHRRKDLLSPALFAPESGGKLRELVIGDPNVNTASPEEDRGHALQGTFIGVYIPIVSSMWGVLIFIRFGIIVGYTGWGLAIGFALLAGVIQMLTTFSLCAVLSNTKSYSNGLFGIFKSNLGSNWAAIICLIYYLGMTSLASVELLGSVQAIDIVLKATRDTQDNITGSSWTDQVVIGGVLLFCTAFTRLFKVSFIHIITATILLVVGCSFVFGFTGVFMTIGGTYKGSYTDPPAELTGLNATTFWNNRLPNFTVPNDEVLNTQIGTTQELVEEYSFSTPASALGTVFPMFLGIFQGANKAADLKTPNTSIFKGTLLAIATSTSLYIFFFAVLAGVAESKLLKVEALLFDNLTWPSQYIGIVATVLVGIGACAELLEIGPTILHTIAMDGCISILPKWGFAKVYRGQPINCVILSFFINFLLLFVTSAFFETLATIVTMFFLQAYLQMHVALLLNEVYRHASWRPTFRYFHWSGALIGGISCLVLMFYIKWDMAIITLFCAYALFLFLEYVEEPKRMGVATYHYRLGRMLRFLLKDEYVSHLESLKEWFQPSAVKQREEGSWTPTVMCFIDDPLDASLKDSNIKLLQIAEHLSENNKHLPHLALVGTVIKADDLHGRTPQEAVTEAEMELFLLRHETNLQAFSKAVIAPCGCSKADAGFVFMQSTGLGTVRPNLLLVSIDDPYVYKILNRVSSFKVVFLVYKDGTAIKWTNQAPEGDQEGVDELNSLDSVISEYIENHVDEEDQSRQSKETIAKTFKHRNKRPAIVCHKGNIDVYWIVRNGGLAVLISRILSQHKVWKLCSIRIFVVAESSDVRDQYTLEIGLKVFKLLREMRVSPTYLTVLQMVPKEGHVIRTTVFKTNGDAFDCEYDDRMESKPMTAKHTSVFSAFPEINCEDNCEEEDYSIVKSAIESYRDILLTHSDSADLIIINLPMPTRKHREDMGLYRTLIEDFVGGFNRVLFVHSSLSDKDVHQVLGTQ